MNPNEILLYAVRDNMKIRAIKALRAVAALSDAQLSLKDAKMLVDSIESAPIRVSVTNNESAIVRIALEPYFVTRQPDPIPINLSSYFTWPEPEPMPSAVEDFDSRPWDFAPGA